MLRNPNDYVILPDRISKEPIAAVLRFGDDQWLEIVNWVFRAPVEAEELGIASQNAASFAQTTDPSIRRFLGFEPGITDGFGLEKLDIQVEKGYIKTDEHYRTGHPNVYAAGDVIGNFLLAHVAYYEGEHIMEYIAGKNPKPLDYNRVPRATYTYPQVASLGLSEKQAKDQGLKVKVGKFPLVGNAKSVILGETEGFVKIISDADSGDLLGVFIIGPNATELISETALAKLLESTPWEIGASIHPHPTVSESVKEAALAVDGLAIHI